MAGSGNARNGAVARSRGPPREVFAANANYPV